MTEPLGGLSGGSCRDESSKTPPPRSGVSDNTTPDGLRRVARGELSGLEVTQIRRWALGTAVNASDHRWHSQPFATADTLVHYVLTGERPPDADRPTLDPDPTEDRYYHDPDAPAVFLNERTGEPEPVSIQDPRLYEKLTGDDIPYHLREDAPPFGQCSVCHRLTWAASEIGRVCNMPQPDESTCPGIIFALPKVTR